MVCEIIDGEQQLAAAAIDYKKLSKCTSGKFAQLVEILTIISESPNTQAAAPSQRSRCMAEYFRRKAELLFAVKLAVFGCMKSP
jgi:hypothetical protein